MLQHFGSLRTLLSADKEAFCKVKGLGITQFIQLQATTEMTKRYLKQELLIEHVFSDTSTVKLYLQAELHHEEREIFMVLFLEYPKCSTCKKAKKWLEEHQVNYDDRHIVEDNPTVEELKDWIGRSGLPLRRFFNTSGMKYRELQLKDRLPKMSEEEQLKLLATNGMLVKRPLIVNGNIILTGFKETEWEKALL